MLLFAKLIILGLFTLTLVYVFVRNYLRAQRRVALAAKYDAGPPGGSGPDGAGPGGAGREAFVAEGLSRYDARLRLRLIALIYVLPIAFLTAMLIYLNTSV